ncbi:DUF1800 domain-containing protein [Nocardioides acrostichi]|uniref:DUF1800 domain-containing protein n=1 Tax=Nocardioides acrostichi TaxID=2784339 RepID=A0A930V0Y5_9ACTN|nr:DUF1800 domain-containing protein [Nocardioides acrostichi]MBF4161700.1 DUF1800 domain-containing protein [Nocardioides acrostichi]
MPGKYKPQRYPATPKLNGRHRQIASRFTYGITQPVVASVKQAGGGLPWARQQIAHAYSDVAGDLAKSDWWPSQHDDAQQVWKNQTSGMRGSWEVMWDYSRRLMIRRMLSENQLLEIMTEFWEGHLHVACNSDPQSFWRVSYGDVIRKHALGRFDEMLKEAALHPAMLLYLDAGVSTKAHPNENLGRELLELHTVGVGHYTEDDVKNASRILTGYKIDMWNTWAFKYSPDDHWTGAVQVGDFSDPNSNADGQQVALDMIHYLAHRPETAQRIALKLCYKFVGDDPSDELVNTLAQTYLANDTDIVPVILRLLRSREFNRSRDNKLRDPAEDLVAAWRAIGATMAAPSTDADAANDMIWQVGAIGLMPMAWPTPDGQPLTNGAWASPRRAMASMQSHWNLAGGWWPTSGVTYKPRASWAPEPSDAVEGPITFGQLVDHMARLVHGKPSTQSVLKACSKAAQVPPDEKITTGHRAVGSRLPYVLATLLDHPTFYSR